jgi:hypothetical protein
VGHSEPKFDQCDQGSRERCPEPEEKKHSGACTNDVRNHRHGERRIGEIDTTAANDCDCDNNALEQKSGAGPAIGKRRIKSLQGFSHEIVRELQRERNG